MAMMVSVKMEQTEAAGKNELILQRMRPKVTSFGGKYLVIATVYPSTQAKRSEPAKFASNKFVFVRITRFFHTTVITKRLPTIPMGRTITTIPRKVTKPKIWFPRTLEDEFLKVWFSSDMFIFVHLAVRRKRTQYS